MKRGSTKNIRKYCRRPSCASESSMWFNLPNPARRVHPEFLLNGCTGRRTINGTLLINSNLGSLSDTRALEKGAIIKDRLRTLVVAIEHAFTDRAATARVPGAKRLQMDIMRPGSSFAIVLVATGVGTRSPSDIGEITLEKVVEGFA